MSIAIDVLPAISIWQPWATLVARGVKRYETRSRATNYRGPMAIHAAKRWTRDMDWACREEPWIGHLKACGIETDLRFRAGGYVKPLGLPLGRVLCVADLVDCRPAPEVLREIGEDEAAFGDFDHGRYAWRYDRIRLLAEPVPCSGKQGFFRLPADVQAAVMAQLEEPIR